MEKKYVIYKASNKINGKMYIGKTYNLEKRKREHFRDIDNELPFHRALKKYGIKNFTWEVIDIAENDIKAREKETSWIKKLNTCIHARNSNGYNITLGGEGGVSWNSRPVVQFTFRGEYVNEYLSSAHADVASGLYRGAVFRAAQNCGTACGYQWRFRDSWTGGDIEPYERPISIKRKKIIQMNLDGQILNVYDSIKDASRKTNIARSNISSCLTGRVHRAGGFQWIYEEQYNPRNDYKFKGIKKGDGIVQLDDNWNIINFFNNCTEAARYLHEPDKVHKQIHKALTSSKRCRGFYWRKYNDYLRIREKTR